MGHCWIQLAITTNVLFFSQGVLALDGGPGGRDANFWLNTLQVYPTPALERWRTNQSPNYFIFSSSKTINIIKQLQKLVDFPVFMIPAEHWDSQAHWSSALFLLLASCHPITAGVKILWTLQLTHIHILFQGYPHLHCKDCTVASCASAVLCDCVHLNISQPRWDWGGQLKALMADLWIKQSTACLWSVFVSKPQRLLPVIWLVIIRSPVEIPGLIECGQEHFPSQPMSG